VSLREITGTEVCYCLWGPAAAEILLPLCDEPDELETLGFLRAATIVVAGVPVLVQRVTFVGEYGFELHAPAEFGLSLWDALAAAGEAHGMVAAGYRALDSLRLEKGYRVWGTDITPVTSPLQAGLGFAVALDKPVEFIGRAALAREPEPAQRIRAIVLDDPGAVVLGLEAIRANGEICGYVTSGGYGYRIDASIAYGYLPAELGPGARIEISMFDRWVPARVAAEPLYDPAGERVRS
jgi:4-methylaminobutanoate oxidase (formaldehyde-forming)